MTENFIDAKYDVTKKSRIIRFYESNKILIYSILIILVIIFVALSYYFENKKEKKILLSENYVQAKIYIEKDDKIRAKEILKDLILANDSTYSALSFFLMLDQKLINDYNEISDLFNHLLKNNEFNKEIKNLLIFKKALLSSNYIKESELLESLEPLTKNESLWKPHALILLGDYFMAKKEFLKAKDFYKEIFLIKDLQQNFYEEALFKIALIEND